MFILKKQIDLFTLKVNPKFRRDLFGRASAWEIIFSQIKFFRTMTQQQLNQQQQDDQYICCCLYNGKQQQQLQLQQNNSNSSNSNSDNNNNRNSSSSNNISNNSNNNSSNNNNNNNSNNKNNKNNNNQPKKNHGFTKNTMFWDSIYLVLVLSDVAILPPFPFSLARVRDWLALAPGDAAATGEKRTE